MTSTPVPTSGALDLSRLPAFSLVDVDAEAIRSARLSSLKDRFAARGLSVDALRLETDPLVILEEEDTYREVLDRQAINDRARGLTLAYAVGPDLDHIGATYFQVPRLDDEADDRYRARLALAPAAKTPGTRESYEFWALTAAPAATDARCLNSSDGVGQPGQVHLVILAPQGQDPAPLVEAARSTILTPALKPMSDDVRIIPAELVTYDVSAIVEIPPGPDAALVEADARARLAVYAADRRRVGRRVAFSGLNAALHAPAATAVQLLGPLVDVEPTTLQAAELGAVNVVVRVTDA